MSSVATRALSAAPLGVAVALDEFDDSHRRHVTVTETRLQNADVPALALLVARAQHVEQLGDMHVLLQLGGGLAAGVDVPALAQRDQLLDDPLQLLGFRQGGLDLFVFNQRAGHVRPQRLAVLVGAVQAAIASCVTHVSYSVCCPLRAVLLCPAGDACHRLSLG